MHPRTRGVGGATCSVPRSTKESVGGWSSSVTRSVGQRGGLETRVLDGRAESRAVPRQLWKDVAFLIHLFHKYLQGPRSALSTGARDSGADKTGQASGAHRASIPTRKQGQMQPQPEGLPAKMSTPSWGPGNSRPPAEGFWVVSCFSPTARGNFCFLLL